MRRPDETDSEFLRTYDPDAYERPSVAVDVVLLSVRDGRMCTLLVRRKERPQAGRWALPGGFVGIQESLESAAQRVLRAKAAIEDNVFVEQLYTFGEPERDPRMRIISVAYVALVPFELQATAGSAEPDRSVSTVGIPWHGATGGAVELRDSDGRIMKTAFDHADIVGMAVKRIRGKLDYTPIGFQLLPETFTLRQLQRVHEVIQDQPVNKDSFRRRMLASGHLEATGERQRDVEHRPAELYRFIKRSAV